MIEKCAKAAYEKGDPVCAKRVPWEVLSSEWKDNWRGIAKIIIETYTTPSAINPVAD